MALSELVPILVIHLYALATAAVLTGFLARSAWLKGTVFWVLACAFAFQALLLGEQLFSAGVAGFSPPFYMHLLSLCVTGTGLWVCRRTSHEALGLAVAPVSMLICLAAFFLRHHQTPVSLPLAGMFFGVHIVTLFCSLGFMTLGFGGGLLFLLQERAIKAKTPLTRRHKDLPDLAALDRVNALSLRWGFPLFTVGILFGFVGARLLWGEAFSEDPKELVSLGLWALYASLYHQRFARGWQGRKPALLAVWVFLISLFSLFVVNTFMITHHSFFTATL